MKEGTFVVRETAAVYPAETPKERMSEYGSESLTDSELLSLIIGRRAVKRCDLAALMSCTVQELVSQGFTDSESRKLLATAEIAKRIWRKQVFSDSDALNVPEKIADYVRQDMRFLHQEVFRVLFLTNQFRLIDCVDMTKGTSNTSLVSPREVIAAALNRNCDTIAICHNHPGGSPHPSDEDVTVTRSLEECCKLMQIRLVDHIIIGGDGYYSFKDSGLL